MKILNTVLLSLFFLLSASCYKKSDSLFLADGPIPPVVVPQPSPILPHFEPLPYFPTLNDKIDCESLITKFALDNFNRTNNLTYLVQSGKSSYCSQEIQPNDSSPTSLIYGSDSISYYPKLKIISIKSTSYGLSDREDIEKLTIEIQVSSLSEEQKQKILEELNLSSQKVKPKFEMTSFSDIRFLKIHNFPFLRVNHSAVNYPDPTKILLTVNVPVQKDLQSIAQKIMEENKLDEQSFQVIWNHINLYDSALEMNGPYILQNQVLQPLPKSTNWNEIEPNKFIIETYNHEFQNSNVDIATLSILDLILTFTNDFDFSIFSQSEIKLQDINKELPQLAEFAEKLWQSDKKGWITSDFLKYQLSLEYLNKLNPENKTTRYYKWFKKLDNFFYSNDVKFMVLNEVINCIDNLKLTDDNLSEINSLYSMTNQNYFYKFQFVEHLYLDVNDKEKVKEIIRLAHQLDSLIALNSPSVIEKYEDYYNFIHTRILNGLTEGNIEDYKNVFLKFDNQHCLVCAQMDQFQLTDILVFKLKAPLDEVDLYVDFISWLADTNPMYESHSELFFKFMEKYLAVKNLTRSDFVKIKEVLQSFWSKILTQDSLDYLAEHPFEVARDQILKSEI